MSVQQYLRQVSVVVGNPTTGQTKDFAAFRCVFQIRRGDTQSPNSCDLRIYNLLQSTMNDISPTNSEYKTLTIQAGYEGNFAQIFTGTIVQVR